MTPSELLARFAVTLKKEVGPNIEAEYPRTQAYLGAVVLQKLAGQLRLEQEHAKAEILEFQALQHDLTEMVRNTDAPEAILEAVANLDAEGDHGLCRLIALLHKERVALAEEAFDLLLARIRRSLRHSLDRRLEYAS